MARRRTRGIPPPLRHPPSLPPLPLVQSRRDDAGPHRTLQTVYCIVHFAVDYCSHYHYTEVAHASGSSLAFVVAIDGTFASHVYRLRPTTHVHASHTHRTFSSSGTPHVDSGHSHLDTSHLQAVVHARPAVWKTAVLLFSLRRVAARRRRCYCFATPWTPEKGGERRPQREGRYLCGARVTGVGATVQRRGKEPHGHCRAEAPSHWKKKSSSPLAVEVVVGNRGM